MIGRLPGITVSAATEDADQFSGREWAQGLQNVFQRFGLVGIVHITGRLIPGPAHEIQPSRRALQMFECINGGFGISAAGNCQSGGNQSVGNLKITGQRKLDPVRHPFMLQFGYLAEALMLDPFQGKEISGPAHTVNGRRPACFAASIACLRPGIIGKNDRRGTFRQQFRKQAHLGGKIMFDGWMIIHVITSKIGKSGG